MPYIVRNYKITKETEKSIQLNGLIWVPKSQISINEEQGEIELSKFIWEKSMLRFRNYMKNDIVDMNLLNDVIEMATQPLTKRESIIIKTCDGISITAIKNEDIPKEYYGERTFSSTWAKSDLTELESFNLNYKLMHFGFYDGVRCYDLGKLNVTNTGKIFYNNYEKLKATCFEQDKYNIYYPKELVELLIEKNNVTKILNL